MMMHSTTRYAPVLAALALACGSGGGKTSEQGTHSAGSSASASVNDAGRAGSSTDEGSSGRADEPGSGVGSTSNGSNDASGGSSNIASGGASSGAGGGPLNDAVQLNGAVEKGPFVVGSTVSISPLEQSGDPTGQSYFTQIKNDLGEFAVSIGFRGLVALEGTGYYYNEVLGRLSNAPLTLRALCDTRDGDEQGVYINLFTHLSTGRVRRLMAQGSDFAEATAQAESELAAALEIGVEEAWPQASGIHLSILSGDESTSTYLLAASAVIAQAAVLRAGENGSVDANLQELLNLIVLDFEDDGQISWDLVSLLDRGEQAVDTSQVVADLQNRLQALGSAAVVPNLALAIDGDLDGLSDETDNCPPFANPAQEDEDGDGVGNACECWENVCPCSTDEDCVAFGDEAAGRLCEDNACVQCSTNDDCVALGDAAAGSVCEEHACVQCSTNDDCVALGDAAAGSVCEEDACVQCSTNDDCVALGDAAAGSVCEENACVQCSTDDDCVALGPEYGEGSCVDSVCQLAEKWACSEVPPAALTQEQIDTFVNLFNLSTWLPEPGVHVSLCATLDLSCQTPRDETDTDADGVAYLTLPAGHTGYLALESEATEPQLFFPTLPIAEGETLGMAFINPDGALEALGVTLGATVDPARGHGRVMVFDCQQQPAVGVTVEFEGNLNGTELYYALAGTPATPAQGATFTDSTGVAGLFNAPLGTLGFTVKLGSRTLGRSQMMIRKGFTSFAPLQVGRALYVR